MAAPAVKTLKQWMRDEDIFDNDLFDILTEQGVNSPDDFAEYQQKQWDELKRRGQVERAKELKDQKAKLRLEKKMTKLEKHWRKASGIKSTSIKGKKKGKKDKPLDNSAAAQNEANEKGKDLKKFLQKQTCFMPDLLLVLTQQDICTEADIEEIKSNEQFDEIYRQVRVLRAKELKDNDARIRMEKQMTKFEKIWRTKTGIKKSSIKKKSKGSKKKDPKTEANDAMASDGKELKAWMRKNDVWEMALYNELMAQEMTDPAQLADVSQSQFDDLVRKVRVERFAQLKDQSARQRADKLLVKFEKLWRKASGIKSTSIKK